MNLQENATPTAERALYLSLTYRCNSSCQFCAADIAYKNDPRFLTLNEIGNLIGDGRYLDIFLSGGEPTIHPNITQIVELCRSHSPCVTALTHGRSFHNRRFAEKLLTAGLNYLIIPLYGSDAASHDRVTAAKGSFDQTIKGLDNLRSLRSSSSFFVEIKLLLTRYTLHLNSRIYRLLRDHFAGAINQISVCPLIYSASTLDFVEQYAAPFEEMRESFYSLIQEIRTDAVFRLRLNEFPPCFLDTDEVRNYAHPNAAQQQRVGSYWYADEQTGNPVDMDGGDFIKTKKGNAFVDSCRRCKYDDYCSSLITSFFSAAYLRQYGESEFHPQKTTKTP